MKRVLSLVLALVLVLGMIPTFAADATGAQALYDNGFITGKDGADLEAKLDVNAQLTRAQLAALIAELNGAKEEAAAFEQPADFTDFSMIAGWAKNFVSYAAVNGWMNGFTDGTFRADASVPAQQLAAVLMNALGYEVVWNTVLADAAELGIVVEGAALTRGEAFEAMWVAVSEVKMADSEMTLGQNLGKLTPPVVVPTTLTVGSVMAVNNKQVEIKFNQAVDSTTALDEANYVIKDKGTATMTLTTASASLSEDKMTVTITLDNAVTDKLTNSTNASVTVKKAVKSATGVALAADFTKADVVVFDGVAPEALSVVATGLKTLEVTFSEPIYDGTDAIFTAGNFEIKSGVYTYFVNSAVALDNVLTLGVGTNLLDGPITITFNKLAEIQDYAGIKAFQGTLNMTFAKDTTAPVATVKEATQTSVKIAFNKPVNATGLKLYHSVSGVANYGDTQNVAAAKEVTFTFPVNKLPQGNVNLYLVNSATAGQEVTDLFGNKMADTNLTTVITIDTEGPTVASTKLNTNATYDITFSENIAVAEAKAANFSVTKVSDGTAKAFTVTNDGLKKVTLNFTLDDNTDYNIVVKAMKDVSGNSMTSQASYVVNAGDNTHPTVTSKYAVSDKVLYIVFSEPMNSTDLANKALYLIDTDNNDTYVGLGADDTITIVTDKKVKITTDVARFDVVNADSDIVLGQLRDLAGKVLGSATTFSTDVTNIPADTLVIDSVQLIAVNKLKVTFSKELANFDNTEFSIKDASDSSPLATAIAVTSIESMTTNSSSKSEVILVLDTNLPADGLYEANGIEFGTDGGVLANTKSVEGTVVSADVDNNAADKVAPSIKAVVYNSTTQIIVSFDEAIDPLSVAGAGTNGFTVSGGTLTSALLVGSNIVLTGTDFTENTDVIYTAGNITDNSTAKNKLATVTKADTLGMLTATPATTPNATATLSLSTVTEAYAAGTASLLTAGGAAAAAQTVGDFTYVIASGLPGTAEALDQIAIGVATTGVITVTITDAVATANSLNGNVVVTIVHVPTGSVETISINIVGTVAVVTAP